MMSFREAMFEIETRYKELSPERAYDFSSGIIHALEANKEITPGELSRLEDKNRELYTAYNRRLNEKK